MHNIIFLEYIEERHVEDITIHVSELNPCTLTDSHSSQWTKWSYYMPVIKKVFQEFFRSYQIEVSIKSVFHNFDIIF